MKRSRLMLIVLLCLLVINIVTGCHTKAVDKEKNQKVVHIEPSSLFEGDDGRSS